MLLAKILIQSCLIIHYIVKTNFCRYCLKAFRTSEKLKFHIKDCFKTTGKQKTINAKKGEYVRVKFFQKNIKTPLMIFLRAIQYQKTMESKIQMSLILKNIKTMLLMIMALNYYVPMISLVKLLSHTQVKKQFTILIIV